MLDLLSLFLGCFLLLSSLVRAFVRLSSTDYPIAAVLFNGGQNHPQAAMEWMVVGVRSGVLEKGSLVIERLSALLVSGATRHRAALEREVSTFLQHTCSELLKHAVPSSNVDVFSVVLGWPVLLYCSRYKNLFKLHKFISHTAADLLVFMADFRPPALLDATGIVSY